MRNLHIYQEFWKESVVLVGMGRSDKENGRLWETLEVYCDPTEYNLQAFYSQRRFVANLDKSLEKTYYHNLTWQPSWLQGDLQAYQQLLFRNIMSPLPPSNSDLQLAMDFNEFFCDKINWIMVGLSTSAVKANTNYIEDGCDTEHRFDTFQTLNDEEVLRIINKSATKSCELDALPMHLLKQHKVLPSITSIVNASLQSSAMPANMKSALVHPLQKKLGLALIKKNYRPVSNLSYIPKVIEQAVCSQLTRYIETTGKLKECQSAYRDGHSTETALLKVKTDFLSSIDDKGVMCLSVAFGMITHDILLNRLKHHFGVTENVLDWIRSYLTQWEQSEVIADEKSPITLKQGVPQGSVLGPVLFTLYMSPLGDLCQAHGLTFHGYADDSQNYLFFQSSVKGLREQYIEVLNNCLPNIRIWMQTNFLKLSEKTEFIMFGTKQQLSKVPSTSITIGDDSIDSVNQVHNLGYHMDSELRNTLHINELCQFCYVTLQKIKAIWHKIDQPTCQIIVQALVLSKLDYCNSVLIGTTN